MEANSPNETPALLAPVELAGLIQLAMSRSGCEGDVTSLFVLEANAGSRFEHPCLVLQVRHPSGSFTQRPAASYRVGPQSITVLHRGFIHHRTRCQINLPTLQGTYLGVEGTIAECRHVSGLFHDSIVRFDEPLDLSALIKWSPEIAAMVAASEQPRELVGRVLCLDPSESERALLELRLGDTKLQVHGVATAAEAYDLTKRSGGWDLIVSEMSDGQASIEEFIPEIRKLGEFAPLLLLTSEAGADCERIADTLGTQGVLRKPYKVDELLAIISSIMPEDGGSASLRCDTCGGYLSSLDASDPARALIVNYAMECKAMVPVLQRAVIDDDVSVCRTAFKRVAGSAAGFGFESLATQASAALTEIDAAGTTVEALACMNMLIRMLDRLSICLQSRCMEEKIVTS